MPDELVVKEWHPLATAPDNAFVLLLCDGSFLDWETGQTILGYYTWAAMRAKYPRQRKARWYSLDAQEEIDIGSTGALAWAPFPIHGIPSGQAFAPASGIEARSAETRSGSVHESPARRETPDLAARKAVKEKNDG